MNAVSPACNGVLERIRAGGWISGQALCDSLRCSRAAVWKQVQALRRQGYAIDARPRIGYRLIRPPDTPLPAEVIPRLTTRVLGRELLWLATVDSTNRLALQKADADAPTGLVVAADTQRAGRGRLERDWFSPPAKNLYASLLLRPRAPLDRIASLTLVLGLAIRRAIRTLAPGLEPRIKWPNDIWLGGRKLCGILCEMRAEPDRVRHVIAGIGLNVNAEAADFPAGLRATATSLNIETGQSYSRAALLAALLNEAEPLLARWEEAGLKPFLDEWAGADLLRGRAVTLTQGADERHGRADGIEPDGSLRLRDSSGSIRLIHSGDVHIRSIDGRRARKPGS